MTARAPVAMFVYKRPEHTRRTLAALARNDGAEDTDLVIFADGPRTAADAPLVEETRRIASAAGGFRSVELVARPGNMGLMENISDGVSSVMDRYGRAIVVEDDLETARGFLDYMNAALSRYRDEPCVWHISGWNYAIDPAGLDPYFFWQAMNCWGWATWSDRWQRYGRDPDRLHRDWSAADRFRFNLDGIHDFYGQIEDNRSGVIRTWAIFWYATIFEAGGLCLNPTESYVRNIGLDGSGEHCRTNPEEPLDPLRRFDRALPDRIEPDPEALARIRNHLALPLHRRVRRRAKRLLQRAGRSSMARLKMP